MSLLKKIAEKVVVEDHEKAYLGSISPYPGQKMWQLNMRTGQITEAVVEVYKSMDSITGKEVTKRKIIVEKERRYVAAINYANARKKFGKIILAEAYQQKIIQNAKSGKTNGES